MSHKLHPHKRAISAEDRAVLIALGKSWWRWRDKIHAPARSLSFRNPLASLRRRQRKMRGTRQYIDPNQLGARKIQEERSPIMRVIRQLFGKIESFSHTIVRVLSKYLHIRSPHIISN